MVGGGSAGHVLPAVPVIEHHLDRGDRVSFIGTRSGMEADLLKDLAVDFYPISAGKLRRYFSWQNFTDVFRIVAGLWQALGILRRLRPDVVFSKGGFVSFPVVVAARLLGLPVVAHESDLTPGLANRLIAPFAQRLCLSFPGQATASDTGKVVTGTPIRREILEGQAAQGRQALGASRDKPVLLITGGSLGAERLNEVVREALDTLTTSYFVVHICGAGKTVEATHSDYVQFEYVGAGWGDMLAAADLVVSRAGANALFEWIALGKPNLLIPLSAEVSRGDQIENAQRALQWGVSGVLMEQDLSPASLIDALRTLEQHAADHVSAMRDLALPDATQAICAELDKVSGR